MKWGNCCLYKYKLLYFVCECMKGRVHCAVQRFGLLKLHSSPKALLCFSLLDALCTSDM